MGSERQTPEGFTRARDNWEGFVKAWPFVPTPEPSTVLHCLHCDRSMLAEECLLDNSDGLIECAFADCDGSALDLNTSPWPTSTGERFTPLN